MSVDIEAYGVKFKIKFVLVWLKTFIYCFKLTEQVWHKKYFILMNWLSICVYGLVVFSSIIFLNQILRFYDM